MRRGTFSGIFAAALAIVGMSAFAGTLNGRNNDHFTGSYGHGSAPKRTPKGFARKRRAARATAHDSRRRNRQ